MFSLKLADCSSPKPRETNHIELLFYWEPQSPQVTLFNSHVHKSESHLSLLRLDYEMLKFSVSR